jgi:hypothetical protein
VVLLACGAGFGAYEAFGSSAPASSVSAGGDPTPTPTSTAAATKARVVTVRVVIDGIGADGFTGRLVSTGQEVTVRLDGSTRYGTTAHPYSQAQLAVGETVVVRARRTGTDTLTATLVVGSSAGSAGSNGAAGSAGSNA